MAIKSNSTIYFKSKGVPDRPNYSFPNHSMMLMAVILEIVKTMYKVVEIQKLNRKGNICRTLTIKSNSILHFKSQDVLK